MADETSCTIIIHTMVDTPSVAADTPAFDHGETTARPTPVPSASKISPSEAATNAPPITAAHETPDDDDSFPSRADAPPGGMAEDATFMTPSRC
jgi:hypothetical protein